MNRKFGATQRLLADSTLSPTIVHCNVDENEQLAYEGFHQFASQSYSPTVWNNAKLVLSEVEKQRQCWTCNTTVFVALCFKNECRPKVLKLYKNTKTTTLYKKNKRLICNQKNSGKVAGFYCAQNTADPVRAWSVSRRICSMLRPPDQSHLSGPF